jgi:hypothetical protein
VSADYVVARGLPSRAELALRSHGTRLRYLGGCRCVPCRAANSRYETGRAAARRAGDWRGLVDAAPVADHLRRLSRAGVGYKAAADAAGVARSVAWAVLAGRKTRVRAHTARRLLAVDRQALADSARVPAGRTWRLVALLLEEGYTRGRIALELGAQRQALQLGRRHVLASTAMRVEQLYRRLTS